MNTNLEFNKAEDLIAYAMTTIDEEFLSRAVIFANEIIENGPSKYLKDSNYQERKGIYEWMDCRDILILNPVDVSKRYGGYKKVIVSEELENEIKNLIKKSFKLKRGIEALVESCESYYNDRINDTSKNFIKHWKTIAKSIDIQIHFKQK